MIRFGLPAAWPVAVIWNYWSINQSLVAMEEVLQIPASFRQRLIGSYVLAALLVVIGFVTLLFMLRII